MDASFRYKVLITVFFLITTRFLFIFLAFSRSMDGLCANRISVGWQLHKTKSTKCLSAGMLEHHGHPCMNHNPHTFTITQPSHNQCCKPLHLADQRPAKHLHSPQYKCKLLSMSELMPNHKIDPSNPLYTTLDKVFITREIKLGFPNSWDVVCVFSGLFF